MANSGRRALEAIAAARPRAGPARHQHARPRRVRRLPGPARGRRAPRDLPVIFLSALDDARDKVNAFRAGGVDYVTKPFQAEEVLARVETQLGLARLRRALAERNRELEEKNRELTQAWSDADRLFAALSDVLPGTLLDERYRLEAKIGVGGSAAVYRAADERTGERVAVKILRPHQGPHADRWRGRFLQEWGTASVIRHRQRGHGPRRRADQRGPAYLVMELLEGETLADEMARAGRALAARVRPRCWRPVCQMLAEAHAAGLIHRDVKPANIFLHRPAGTGDEVVKVVDFGIAKLLEHDGTEDHTTLGRVMGTPMYMSPERLLGRALRRPRRRLRGGGHLLRGAHRPGPLRARRGDGGGRDLRQPVGAARAAVDLAPGPAARVRGGPHARPQPRSRRAAQHGRARRSVPVGRGHPRRRPARHRGRRGPHAPHDHHGRRPTGRPPLSETPMADRSHDGETLDQAIGGQTRAGAGPPVPGLVLAFSSGRAACAPVPLTGGAFEIGRGPWGEAALDDPLVSRAHARVAFDGQTSRWRVHDLGSRNGTAVDGQALEREYAGPCPRVVRVGGALVLPYQDVRPFLTAPVAASAAPEGSAGDDHGPHARPRLGGRARPPRATTRACTSPARAAPARSWRRARFHRFGPARRRARSSPSTAPPSREALAERLLFGARRGAYSGADADAEGYLQAAARRHPVPRRDRRARPARCRPSCCACSRRARCCRSAPRRPREVDVARLLGDAPRSARRGRRRAASARISTSASAAPRCALPPLRDRLEEIPWLVERELGAAAGRPAAHVSLVEACLMRRWPGNVRELLVEIRTAARHARSDDALAIAAPHLASTAGLGFAQGAPAPPPAPSAPPPSAPRRSAPHPIAPPWRQSWRANRAMSPGPPARSAGTAPSCGAGWRRRACRRATTAATPRRAGRTTSSTRARRGPAPRYAR